MEKFFQGHLYFVHQNEASQGGFPKHARPFKVKVALQRKVAETQSRDTTQLVRPRQGRALPLHWATK